MKVSIQHILDAKKVLDRLLEPTPLVANRWLSESLGCEVFLKLENMQPIGSFKIRGATYKISKLTSSQMKKGVVTASAGNHAQGVAWGCSQFGVKATIVMPKTAPLTKVQNTASLGAQILLEGENYDQAHAFARKLASKSGQIFVHPYDDIDVISGQGTVGLEICEQLSKVDAVIGSMGGGGLMSGVGVAFKNKSSQTSVIGVQTSGARSLVESIRRKKIYSTGIAETFADGIKVIEPSPSMLSILKTVIDQTFTADDEEVASAVLTLMEKAKIVSEGAGAVPLAVLQQLHKKFRNKRIVLIISGGNIDVNVISRIIDRGLILAGRRVRVNVFINDKPGSLNRLTQLIAAKGANIIQAIHDRNSHLAGINQTAVELTLETRGPEYSLEIIEALKKEVISLEEKK